MSVWEDRTLDHVLEAHQRVFDTLMLEACVRILGVRLEYRPDAADKLTLPTSAFKERLHQLRFGRAWLLEYREERVRLGGML